MTTLDLVRSKYFKLNYNHKYTLNIGNYKFCLYKVFHSESLSFKIYPKKGFKHIKVKTII